MEEAIKNFAEQFNFKPEVQNAHTLSGAKSFVLCGMGGSHLAGGLLKMHSPDLDLYIHRDYGLPALSHKKFEQSLFIASSYSGNTEEVLDFAQQASSKKYAVAVIASGGKLIDFAKENNLPYIVLPSTGIQPRSAIGYSLLALVKMIGDEEIAGELAGLSLTLSPSDLKIAGQKLAENISGKIPIIYSSRKNLSLAYIWKILFNETAKIPAFYNVFSELNHNEMTSFDVVEKTKSLSEKFHFIFLTDDSDNPKIGQRMLVTQKMFEERGLPVTTVALNGATVWEKIFNSLLLADWTALSLSGIYGTEAEQVPMVEEFKKLIS